MLLGARLTLGSQNIKGRESVAILQMDKMVETALPKDQESME